MGDLQAWPQPDGNVTEEKESAAATNPLPSSIDGKIWCRAEERTSEIILCVQPTVKSEQKRNEVICYVQRLIQRQIGCQVFPFGSVPLKTYLPDGDVDLTTFSNFPNVEDKWANDVRIVLEGEEYNNFAEFRVREVQVIRAEVKLVKCLVDNIVVDISFNQLGGLCTLCFLEKVDRLIGKDHLFKRSIILVKAWCYYESRILGAHHGLISTYALETLVLYIFHLFHASLHGPLEVLYRFLDYFSKFDWDNYCVSLLGPVVISTLPDIKVLTTEPPETVGGELLLNEEFLKSCTDLYSVPSKSHDNQRSLTRKYLNIIDPLRENNNLGRSVSKGNFYRIRSAFSYGARKLGKILLSSEERIAEELDKFFLNTLERHGRGQRPDVSDSIECSPVGESTSFLQSSKADAEDNKHDNKVFTHQIKSSKGNGNSTELSESDGLKRISDVSLESRSTIAGAFQVNLCGEIKKNKTALVDSSSKLTGVVSDVVYSPRHSGETKTKQGIKSSCFSNILSNCSCRSDSEMHREENSVYGNCISMDAKDLTNVPSHHDYLRSKSPGVLAEHEISTHCSYCEPSANVKSKAVTGSVLKNTKIYVFCQGHMSIKDRKDWGSHEATVSNHMYCSVPCDHDDRQTASYVENLSISDPVSVGKEGMGAKSRCMMSNSFQRDNLSSHVPDAKSFVHSNKAPLLQSPLVAALSVPHPCVATGHSQYLNSPLWNSGTLLPNSLMCGPLENGKLQEDKYSQPELKFHDSFTAMENSEQRTSSKLSLKGNNKVNHNDSVNVSNRNIFSEARRDALPAGHISYPERKSGVHECVENLPSCFADNANFNTDIPPQGDAPISHSSGLNGPVICGNNHLLEVDHRVTSLEEPSSTSREHTPSSFHLNPSKISRVSDGATSKYVDVPFCADKSLNESRPNSESGASCMEEMQGGAGLHSLKCLKCDLTADFECHLENLDFGKRCQESIVQGSIPPYPVVAPYMQDYYVPDGLGRPFPGNANMFPYVHGGYRVPPGHPFLPVGYRNANPLLLPFGMEESPKPRSGTGTYFPNTNLRSYKERCSNRGRTQGPPGQELNHHVGNQMHRARSNGRNKTSFQNFQRQTGHKSIDREGDISHIWKNPDQVLDPMVGLMGPDLHSNTIGNGKVPISPNANPSRPVTMMQPYSNGSDFPPKQLKFGSFGPVQVDLINTTVKSEDDRHLDSDNLNGQLLKSCSEAANASSDRILQKEGALLNHERKQSWSSLLKDAEFPPLSESQHGRSSTNAGRNHNSNNRGSHWQASMTTS